MVLRQNQMLFLALCSVTIMLFLIFHKEHNQKELLNDLVPMIREDEALRMAKQLILWKDEDMMKQLSKHKLADDDVKKLYYEFKKIIVTPPNPETYTEYSIEDAEGALERTDKLGKLMLNTFMVMSEEELLKYGDLISVMRDGLCFDVLHIPLAIRHDNSRDIYWYEIHINGVQVVDEAFKETFRPKNTPTPTTQVFLA